MRWTLRCSLTKLRVWGFEVSGLSIESCRGYLGSTPKAPWRKLKTKEQTTPRKLTNTLYRTQAAENHVHGQEEIRRQESGIRRPGLRKPKAYVGLMADLGGFSFGSRA